jgi:ABC-type lipoprotein release transport system permease subunit
MFRNKRRTLIMVSSVFFAVIVCLITMSLTNGSCDYIVDAIVERQTGTLQVMSPEYWEDKTVDNYLMVNEATLKQWEQTDNVKRIAPRIESYAMAWNGKRTKGVAFIGIDPKRESVFSRLDSRMINGDFLSQEARGVMVGEKCAEILGLTVGDTLTLIGMGYQGESANGLFPVVGILRAFDPNLDAAVVYTSLAGMQEFISMPGGVSTVSVLLKDAKRMKETGDRIQETGGEAGGLVFKPWQDLIEGTMAGASENKKQIVVYLYFLYGIVGFGLLSMVIMLTNERKKEFGVMAALGAKKRMIISSLIFEMIFVALLGIVAGVVVCIPIVAYYHYDPFVLTGELADALAFYGLDPIMPFEFTLKLFVTQPLIVFSMAIAVSCYPIVAIRRMRVMEAIRN